MSELAVDSMIDDYNDLTYKLKDRRKNYIYEGKLNVPKGEQSKDWKVRNPLLFKSTGL